tara:strand:+ start:5630 stop:6388 length:759 start_codon:yes stop_codon:yes gene_type:complete
MYKFINLRFSTVTKINHTHSKPLKKLENNKKIINNIELKGYYEGLILNENLTKKFLELCKKTKIITTLDDKNFNSFEEVNNFNKNTDKPYTLLNLYSHELQDLTYSVARDEELISIAEKYLGRVNKIDTKVQWSPLCKADNDWREKNGQTVTYHYDVHHLNFLYVFFYLTDCNEDTGAHELIIGSHLKKNFFNHLLGSAKKNEDNLIKYYGRDNFKIVEGNAGYGFIEDTSCYHRARVPIKNDRIAIQFRYY